MNNSSLDIANQKNTSQRYYLWWLIIFGIIGLVSYIFLSNDVFPSASIDLNKPKTEIIHESETWTNQLGYKTQKAIKSTIFNFDDDTKTFLEYELGLKQANKLMKDQIPVWYWSSRFCHPFMLEEFDINLSPAGELVSFEHTLENNRALPKLDHAKALQMAKSFIEQQPNQKLSSYQLIEDGVIAQSHRVDHYFIFENQGLNIKGAHPRIYIYVSGNIITVYNRYLHIPEDWSRKFNELRSYNKSLEEIASIFYSFFTVITFFIFAWAFITGRLRWRFALTLALLVALFDLAESFNSMPATLRNYTTTLSFNGYVIEAYFSALLEAINQFLQSFVLVGAAEALYRQSYPQKLALENIITKLGVRCQQTLSGLIAGCGTFGIHIGWIIAYYLIGRSFGFWSPLEIKDTEALSTSLPFLSAMNVGLSAAIFEELTYRVLGLALFQKLCKNYWIANLLQAAAWAFMHSNYAQEPPYARGLELTVVGFFYGAILKKYGLLPCIVAHYTFDAFLGVTPLITSWLLSLKLTAAIAVAPAIILLLLVILAIKKYGFFKTENQLANANISTNNQHHEGEEIFAHEPFQYQPLSASKRIILVGIILIATIIQFGYFFPAIGSKCKLTVNRQAAANISRKYLIDHGIVPTGLTESTYLAKGIDHDQFQYIFENAHRRRAEELAQVPGQPLIWKTRFFRPLTHKNTWSH